MIQFDYVIGGWGGFTPPTIMNLKAYACQPGVGRRWGGRGPYVVLKVSLRWPQLGLVLASVGLIFAPCWPYLGASKKQRKL